MAKTASYSPDVIRNIVLVGHGGAGKTSLIELMLNKAGVTTRLGTVEEGNTVCDFDELEHQRKHSIDSSVAYLQHGKCRFNIIDTPGYPDFIGQAICALVAAETAIIVVSASAGIEVNTRKLFATAGQYGLARVVVVNKIDAENVDLPRLVAALQDSFGRNLLPMNLPADGGKKIVSCLVKDQEGQVDFSDLDSAHTALIEAVVESDEQLMERYLGGEEIPSDELAKALGKSIVQGALVPILFTSARNDTGVAELMDAVANCCPSPQDGLKRSLQSGQGESAQQQTLQADPAGPMVAQTFKIYGDPRSNIRYSIMRLHSGTLRSEDSLQINQEKRSFRTGHLYRLQGSEQEQIDQAIAGDIIALAKIDELKVGHVAHIRSPGTMDMPKVPEPMYSLAIEPKSRGDEQKLSGTMTRLADEDKTFKVTRDRQTNELVVSGIGDLHLRMMLQRMQLRFKLEVTTKPPKIPYHETITVGAEGHYRHKKQTGGAGQFGEVYLKVEPMDRDAGFEFVNDIFGASIPTQYVASVEKGVRDLLERGAVAGFPIQDIRVSVYDGKHHPVDSKDIAFRIAGKFAMKEAVLKAKPALLEPIVNLEVTVPSQHVGDITSDLSSKRGRISGQDVLAGGMAVIKAQVPLAEVAQYNTQVRSITGGQGSYSMELSHYDMVPPNVQAELVKQFKPKAEEE